ncbi:hypothetical protein ACLMJK_001022 [Lecanora helva]
MSNPEDKKIERNPKFLQRLGLKSKDHPILQLHPEFPALYDLKPFVPLAETELEALDEEGRLAYQGQKEQALQRSSRPTYVLGDDMGLGKTISFLVLSDPDTVETVANSTSISTAVKIEQSTADVPRIDHLQRRRYKPTLILFPNNAAEVWRGELRRHFPQITTVRSWFRNPHVGKQRERANTLGTSPPDLTNFVTNLPDEPATSRVIILSSLETIRYQSLYIREGVAMTLARWRAGRMAQYLRGVKA